MQTQKKFFWLLLVLVVLQLLVFSLSLLPVQSGEAVITDSKGNRIQIEIKEIPSQSDELSGRQEW